jgi:hypothetical protein
MRPLLLYQCVECVKAKEWCIHLWKKRARYARVKNRYVLNVEDAAMFVSLNLHDAKTVKELDKLFI